MSGLLASLPAQRSAVGATAHGLGRADGARARNRWRLAIATTIAVHALGFIAFRVPVPVRFLEEPRAPMHAWAGDSSARGGSLLDEQLLLFDNAPLFLPTEWNAASSDAVRPAERSPADLFGSFAARLHVPGTRVPEVVPLLPSAIEEPYRGLRLSRLDATSALARTDPRAETLPARTAAVVVSDGFSGAQHESFEIMLGQDAVRGWPDWAPMELLVHVDPAGWNPPPIVSRSSGSVLVDAHFRDYVRSGLRMDLRWRAGFYRVEIGP